MNPQTSTTLASTHPAGATTSSGGDTTRATPAELTPRRLAVLRLGYLVVGGGLALTKWPLLFSHDRPWATADGVVTCLLVAMSLLALLGLRHPVRMLPILLFESAWKLLWIAVVALPQALAGDLDPATAETFNRCLWVVIVLAVVPWRHVVTQYLRQPGDPWRSRPTSVTA
jgi:hypothetical protein